MKKRIILLVVVAVIVGGYFLLGKGDTDVVTESSTGEVKKMPMEKVDTPILTETQNTQIEAGKSPHAPTSLTFDVNGGNFYFTPSEIRVKKGDTITIKFKNDAGFHDFKLDEFNVATERTQGGAVSSVTFVADKTGNFEYYCSVGTHRAMGMNGALVVE